MPGNQTVKNSKQIFYLFFGNFTVKLGVINHPPQDLNSYIHFLVFAAMCVAGVGVAWGLPETRDQCLKTTMHGEDLRSDSGESSAEVKL